MDAKPAKNSQISDGGENDPYDAAYNVMEMVEAADFEEEDRDGPAPLQPPRADDGSNENG